MRLVVMVVMVGACAPQAQPTAEAPCLPYDRPVALSGVVQRIVANHDAYFVLVPRQPLCTVDDDFDPAEYEVRQVQLVGYPSVTPSPRVVQITGELMHGYTAAHHTEVLMGPGP